MSNTPDISAYRSFATNSNHAEFRFWMNHTPGWVHPNSEGDHLFVVHRSVEEVYPGVFIAEQWTGYLDKNGKKIFEGDLLTCPSIAEMRKVPESTLFLVQRLGDTWEAGCFTPHTDVFLLTSLLNQPPSRQWEVVGNIHEGITLNQA